MVLRAFVIVIAFNPHNDLVRTRSASIASHDDGGRFPIVTYLGMDQGSRC